jgi:hypothetical protein
MEMDRLGLSVLAEELASDARLFVETVALARARMEGAPPSASEAAAYQLARAYNIIEQAASRIAGAFENQVGEGPAWHERLVHRMSLAIPGVRPALFPAELARDVRELKAFRHVVRHAYDLDLDPGRLRLVLAAAERVAEQFPVVITRFVQAVRAEQGWTE